LIVNVNGISTEKTSKNRGSGTVTEKHRRAAFVSQGDISPAKENKFTC